MSQLNVEIVTPSDKFFEGQAYMVTVPGIHGSLGFLPGHVGLVCPLGEGGVVVSDKDNTNDSSSKSFHIKGGYVEIYNDNVLILAEHVE